MSDQEEISEYWQGFVGNNLKCMADDLDKATNDGHTSTYLRVIGGIPNVGQSSPV